MPNAEEIGKLGTEQVFPRAIDRPLPEQSLRQPRLPDHRLQRADGNVVARGVRGDGHQPNPAGFFLAIDRVAARGVPVQAEAVRLDDPDELAERALQARQGTWNPTTLSRSGFLPKIASSRIRNAQRNRT